MGTRYLRFLIDLSRHVVGGLFGPDVVAEGILHVDKAEVTALGHLVHSLEFGIGQLDALEVGLDALGVGRLGENDVAAAQTPGDQDLGEGVAALLGDLEQGLVLGHTLTGGGDLVSGSPKANRPQA